MGMQDLTNIIYLIAAILFILDLKMLAHPRTAVRGNQLGALGMVLAIVATLMSGTWDWTYIILGIGIGSLIGAIAALRVKMTSMPELVGLFNGFGGAASVLVAGRPVKLQPDGSFTVRMELPDKRQVLPVTAESRDGLRQRTTVVAVERNTKIMEPVELDDRL